MGRLLFASYDAYFNLLKSGRLEPLVQIAFDETEPAIPVKLVGPLEFVLQEVQKHDLASRFDDFVSGSDSFGRFFRVMQRLAENRKVNALGFHWRVLEIAATEFEIFEIVFFGLCSAESDDFLRIIDRDHLFGSARKQFAQETFTRTEIGYHQGRQDTKQEMAESLPGTAGAINPIEPASDLIEIQLGLLAPAIQDTLEIDLIAGTLGQFLCAPESQLDELFFAIRLRTEFIISAFPFATGFDKARIEEQAEMS
jgi:hypothetical protein